MYSLLAEEFSQALSTLAQYEQPELASALYCLHSLGIGAYVGAYVGL